MQAYLCDEGLARFCTNKYQEPDRSNMKDAHMHLTNFSINKKSANFNEKEVEDIYEPNYASKRTLTSVMKQIALRSPEKMEELRASIKNTCAGTAAMLMNMILHNNHWTLKN